MDNESSLSRIWNYLKKPAISISLRVALSGIVLLYLVRISAFSGIALAFSRIKPAYLLGFFLLYFLSLGLQSLRWKYLLKMWGVTRYFVALFRSIMIGLFLSNFLPGSFGGDLYRLYAGGRDTGQVEAVGATIFYERLFSYGSLVTLGLVALSIRSDFDQDWLFWLLLGGALLGLLILSALFSISAFERWAQSFIERISFARKLRLTDWLKNFQFRAGHPRNLVAVFLISFLIQIMDVSCFRLVSIAIQLPVKFNDLLLFVPLLYLAIMMPISFNGIGVRETVFVIFSSIWRIASADAVAFSLTVFALNLAGSLVGGIIYWFDRPASDKVVGKSRLSE
jgi:glycosyltransferase 2 family protein